MAPAPTWLAQIRGHISVLLERRAVLLLLLPALVMLFAWPPLSLVGFGGLDASWMAGLEMATHAHLAFGTQIIFTYGPLGFLYVAASGGLFTWYSGLAVLGFIYTLIGRFALAWVVFHGARRSFGTVFGFISATAVLRVYQTPDIPVFLIALVWALGTAVSPRRQEVVCVLAGAAAGVEVLEKVSIGTTAAVLVLIAVCCLQQRRARVGAESFAAFLATLVVAWLAAGQPLSALPRYVHAAEQISVGYSNALQVTAVGWQTGAAAFGATFGFWAAWRGTTELARRQRVGVLLLWAVFTLSIYKEGFTRADPSHVPLYFGAILSGFFAFRIRAPDRTAAVIGIAAVAFFCMAAAGSQPNSIWRVDLGASAAATDTKNLLTPSQRALDATNTRANIRKADAVPRQAIALLKSHTADVVPTELAIAWAYRLDWRPIPVLQSYSAYTPWLDQHDAAFLRSKSAPDRLLLQAGYGSIDGRVLSYDEPETTVAMLCSYRPILTTTSYAVLARAANRCGSERLIKSVRAGWGQTVHVPKPRHDELVLVKITGVQVGIAESIEGSLSQSAQLSISLNGMTPPFRLLPGTAADGLPLSTSTALDYPVPFNTTLSVKTVAVGRAGVTETAGEAASLTYAFYSLQIKPWGSERK